MKTVSLLVLLAATLPATSETVLKADRIADLLVLNQVYLNQRGPYRMMIDTGNGSSILRPAVADRLGLRPAYAVEAETTAGVQRVAAAILDTVRIGSVEDKNVEVMITGVKLQGVDGVLGQSWLARHDYVLDYRKGRVVVDISTPPAGIRVPLRSADGRPQVSGEVNGRPQDLVVDSGTSVLVLFGPISSVRRARLVSNSGAVDARTGSAQVTIGEGYRRQMAAAEVDAAPQPALLPAGAFRAIYIGNRDGTAVFVP